MRGFLARELAPDALGNHLDPETIAHQRGVLRSAIDRVGHAVEREIEGGIGNGEAWQHLDPEEAGVQAPEPADRAEAVTGSCRRGNRAGPVRSDAELIRGERVRLLAREERHGIVGDLGEQHVELRDGLALREPADVDTPDASTLGELARRAGERKPQQHADHGEEPRDECKRHAEGTAAPASTSARGDQRRVGAHRTQDFSWLRAFRAERSQKTKSSTPPETYSPTPVM